MFQKQIYIALILFIFFPSLTYAKVSVDDSGLEHGIIRIKNDEQTDKPLRLLVEANDQKEVYYLIKQNEFEDFALTFGNGHYTLSIYRPIEDSKYLRIFNVVLNLSVADERSIYLNATQEIAFEENDFTIKHTKKLIDGSKTDYEKFIKIYEDVLHSYSYDYEKIATLKPTYIPKIDAIFYAETGICYDFSALFAAMSRSVGIPTKLVKGTSNLVSAYHSWNEVYLDGQWHIVDLTFDIGRYKSKRAFSIFKNVSDYFKELQF